MKQYLIISITLLLIIIVANCQPTSPASTFDKAARQRIEQEVRTMLEQYFDAIRAEGLEGEFAYLDSSATFFWVPPGYTSRLSYDSVATILRSRAPAFQKINFQWDDLYLDPLSPDIVSYNGIVKGSMLDTAGQQNLVHLIETGLLIKRADGWKLLSGQSAILPQKE